MPEVFERLEALKAEPGPMAAQRDAYVVIRRRPGLAGGVGGRPGGRGGVAAAWEESKGERVGGRLLNEEIGDGKVVEVGGYAERGQHITSPTPRPRPADTCPVLPMLATKGDHVPSGAGWAHEVKWDGMRVLVENTSGSGDRSRPLRIWFCTKYDVTVRSPAARARRARGRLPARR